MEPFRPTDLLDAWERGRDASIGERGLLLLAAMTPDASPSALAMWSVGRRDAALLALREQMFGLRLAGLVTCPHCGEPLEIDLAVADIMLPPGPDPPLTMSLVEHGYHLRFRLPSAGDMAALAQVTQVPERWLLECCILDAHLEDAPCLAAMLPDAVLEAMASAIAEADPQADVELAVTCPACSAPSESLFDIVSFLWQEIDAWATRTLREIHVLSSTYGWSERHILSLSPWRRRYYLELIGG